MDHPFATIHKLLEAMALMKERLRAALAGRDGKQATHGCTAFFDDGRIDELDVWDKDAVSVDVDYSVSASTMDREPWFDEITFNDKSVSYHLTSTREVLFSEGIDPFFNQAYSALEVFDQMPSPGFDGEPIFNEEPNDSIIECVDVSCHDHLFLLGVEAEPRRRTLMLGFAGDYSQPLDHFFVEELDTHRTMEICYCDGNHVVVDIDILSISESLRTPSSTGEFECVKDMPWLRHPIVLCAWNHVVTAFLAVYSALKMQQQELFLTAEIGSDHVELPTVAAEGFIVVEVIGSNMVSVAEAQLMCALVLKRNLLSGHQRGVGHGRRCAPGVCPGGKDGRHRLGRRARSDAAMLRCAFSRTSSVTCSVAFTAHRTPSCWSWRQQSAPAARRSPGSFTVAPRPPSLLTPPSRPKTIPSTPRLAPSLAFASHPATRGRAWGRS
jgi:hypothetical protein